MNINELKEIYNNDLFARKKHIQVLTEYISSYEEECKVMSIHSPWGTGKTTFIKLWKYHLENDNNLNKSYYPIYFNAWANDDSQSPLISLLIELNEINEFKNTSDLALIASVGSILITKTPKFLLKGLLGLIPINPEIKNDIYTIFETLLNDGINKDTLNELINNENKEEIEKIIDQCNEFNIELLRYKLKELFIKKLEKFQKQINKKIIFFIDELDRCRPTFAIEILEIIKHLFYIKDYNFILSWDLEQLSYSIGTIYGANMNTGGYLRRFIDFEYSLPKISTFSYIEYKYQWNRGTLLVHLINAFDFSVRDINKIMNLALVNKDFDKFHSQTFHSQAYNDYSNSSYLQLFGYLFLLLKYKEPIYHIKLKNKVLIASEEEELINILKKYSDSAIISYNSSNPINPILPIEKEIFKQLINIFLTIDSYTIIKITEDINIDISRFINRINNINYLLDITLY